MTHKNKQIIRISYVFLLALILGGAALFSAPKVIIISADGYRADAYRYTKTPNIDWLRKNGLRAAKAKTITPSLTLPSHTSMLTGLSYHQHGVNWNNYRESIGTLEFSTFMAIAKDNGLSTAMFISKDKLFHLYDKSKIDRFYYKKSRARDLMRAFLDDAKNNGVADASFIHFRDADKAGHNYGWMSAEYLRAIREVDEALGLLISAVKQSMTSHLYIIFTADHGGKGYSHSDNIAENRYIPWIIGGPNLPRYKYFRMPISTYDTAATALDILGIEVPSHWSGNPVKYVSRTLRIADSKFDAQTNELDQ